MSHWHGKQQPVKLDKLKPTTLGRSVSSKGVGYIQVKDVGDIWLAVGYADILDKIATFTE